MESENVTKKVNGSGFVKIPRKFRKQLGLDKNVKVVVELGDDCVVIRKYNPAVPAENFIETA